jgi:hypothetical protein
MSNDRIQNYEVMSFISAITKYVKVERNIYSTLYVEIYKAS